MTNIFIANLDWDITSEDLLATFSAFGEVHLAHVVFDAKTKQSKGFGYVEMESAEQAINAIQALHGIEVNGRQLDVKIASPKANRPKKEDKPESPFKKPVYGDKKPFNKNYNSPQSKERFTNNKHAAPSAPRSSSESSSSTSSSSAGAAGGSTERVLRPRKKNDN